MSYSQMSQANYNTKVIRKLLAEAFSDEDLKIFCYDNFRPVYEKFGDGMTKLGRIQLLIEHCERKKLVSELLFFVKEANPSKHEEFAPFLQLRHQERSANPFHYGSPVLPERFIGHRWALKFCQNKLSGHKPVNISISGERRIGKTSLLHYLHKFGSEKEWGQHVCLYLDCGIFGGCPTSTNFWREVLRLLLVTVKQVSPVVDLIGGLRNQPDLTGLDFRQFLNIYHSFDNEQSIILLLDEFEQIFHVYDQDIESLLKGLRTIALEDSNKITLVTATRDSLRQVCHPFIQKTGLEFSSVSCPLNPFPEKETVYVVQTLLANTNIEFTSRELNYIWELSQWQGQGAHPILVQVAASLIFEHKQNTQDPIGFFELEQKFEEQTSLYRGEVVSLDTEETIRSPSSPKKRMDYGSGLNVLEQHLPDNSLMVSQFYALRRQLLKNIQIEDIKGFSAELYNDRNTITKELTRLSLQIMGLSFEQLISSQTLS